MAWAFYRRAVKINFCIGDRTQGELSLCRLILNPADNFSVSLGNQTNWFEVVFEARANDRPLKSSFLLLSRTQLCVKCPFFFSIDINDFRYVPPKPLIHPMAYKWTTAHPQKQTRPHSICWIDAEPLPPSSSLQSPSSQLWPFAFSQLLTFNCFYRVSPFFSPLLGFWSSRAR